MRFCLTDFLYSFAGALDVVESQIEDIEEEHTLKVAYMTGLLTINNRNYSNYCLEALLCSILHDNAIGLLLENTDDKKQHLIVGENNLKGLFFLNDIQNVVLYHHENIDGSGPFNQIKIPIISQYIHIAHDIDTRFVLKNIDKEMYEEILEYIISKQGILYSEECINHFVNTLTYSKMKLMRYPMIEIMDVYFPKAYIYKNSYIYALCRLLANIVDSHSSFTRHHSLGVANKAMKIAKYYNLGEDKECEYFFAGAVHDLGKMVINRNILEKNDKLTNIEMDSMQNHAYYTYKILQGVEGLEEVTKWASYHHEKLDGSGYPFGLDSEDLRFPERVIAMVDIYQALTEKRPYKEPFSHTKAIDIMMDMANDNKIDKKLVELADKLFK